MKPIQREQVQKKIEALIGQDLYVHLETTNGAYTGYHDPSILSTGAYIRNGKINFTQGKITGSGPFRVGLKIELGWIYAEGLTDWEIDDQGRLLMAGHNPDGKLAIALELSPTPFK